jgi:hypothetical protein
VSLGDTAESDLLKLIFQNTNWANVGDATGLRGSTAAGSFYVSLATANPGETGTQLTSEAAYTNYARVAVSRSGATGWTISGTSPTQAANTAATTFPQSASGPETESHFVVGRDSSGAGEILWYGALTASLVVNNLVTPSFAIGALVCTAD